MPLAKSIRVRLAKSVRSWPTVSVKAAGQPVSPEATPPDAASVEAISTEAPSPDGAATARPQSSQTPRLGQRRRPQPPPCTRSRRGPGPAPVVQAAPRRRTPGGEAAAGAAGTNPPRNGVCRLTFRISPRLERRSTHLARYRRSAKIRFSASSRDIPSACSATARENPARASAAICFARPAASTSFPSRNGPMRRLRTNTNAAASSVSASRAEAARASSGATPLATSRSCTDRSDWPARTRLCARFSANAASLTAPALRQPPDRRLNRRPCRGDRRRRRLRIRLQPRPTVHPSLAAHGATRLRLPHSARGDAAPPGIGCPRLGVSCRRG